jgi:hypothetical protein
MANLGRYCKAYYLSDLRAFSGWTEPAASNGERRPDDTIVYVHEQFTVTEGLAADQGVLFSGTGGAWESFCRDTLRYEPPSWATEPIA